MSELRVSGLRKTFPGRPPTEALRGVNLCVRSGTLAAVLGPSGCGKTTLLRIIAGFEHPDAGTVTLDGVVVAGRGVHVAPEKRRIGVVPQEGALFPHLSVAANVGFGLRRGARRSGRVEELLELVGLAGLGRRMPHELSGGQQQRVAVARALAPEPSLVLLDEPFSALDAGLRAAVRADVRAALKAAGATALLVTHDQTEALSMADSVAIMRDGAVVQADLPTAVYRSPADLGVARFLGDAVVVAGTAVNGTVECVLGSLPIVERHHDADGPVAVLLRPEQLALVAPGGAPITATVLDTQFFGHDALVRLAIGEPAVEVTARAHAAELPAPGTVVGVRVEGAAATYPPD